MKEILTNPRRKQQSHNADLFSTTPSVQSGLPPSSVAWAEAAEFTRAIYVAVAFDVRDWSKPNGIAR